MVEQKILVIEDNQLNTVLVRDLLTLSGFRVLEAVDAETGLRLAREHRPDAILMDIQLPGMDGLEATRIIRGDTDLKQIPVVALTSYAMEKDRSEALAAGCTDFIAKPIDTRSFVQTIAQLLPGRQFEKACQGEASE